MNYKAILRQCSNSIYTSDNLQESVDLLSETSTRLGFDGACSLLWPGSITSHAELTAPTVMMVGSDMTISKKWSDNYIKKGFFKADFVYRACRDTTLPVVWNYDASPDIVVGANYHASLTEITGCAKMVDYTGLLGGISIPIHGIGSFFGYVTFVSKQHLPWLLERKDELGDNLLGFVHRFYDAIADKLVCDIQGERLTARELECLSLLGLGKTLNETAEILGLSYSTIRFHLQNAEQKLGTTSRAHAIAKAASKGLLGRID